MKQSEREVRFPVFRERFTELRGDQSNTEFADFLGMSRQSVGFYINGDRIPDILGLHQIAERCNISANWLLGLSEVKSPAAEIQQVCDYTGLTEKAVKVLNSYRDCSLVSVISELIEQEEWIEEIDSVSGIPILKTIKGYLAIDRSSSRIYQLSSGVIEERKSLIARDSIRDIKASDIEERVLLSDIETMLKRLKEKHIEK